MEQTDRQLLEKKIQKYVRFLSGFPLRNQAIFIVLISILVIFVFSRYMYFFPKALLLIFPPLLLTYMIIYFRYAFLLKATVRKYEQIGGIFDQHWLIGYSFLKTIIIIVIGVVVSIHIFKGSFY